jgi:hypothetical protein
MIVAKFQRFEGFWATPRGIAMLKEARRIFTARTGRKPPGLSQGGLSTGVSASAGTHAREAFDSRTSGWSAHYQREWEIAMWTVGFGSWHRYYLPGVWPEHNHAIPKGGDLSPAAHAQERAFRLIRDGLRGNRPYTAIGKYAAVTWESYQASKKGAKIKIGNTWYPDIGSVSLPMLVKVWRSGSLSRNAWYVQWWLRDLNLYTAPIDGRVGPKTKAAYDAFRSRVLKLKGKDATGDPGYQSLSALRARAKTHKKPVTR